MRPDVPPAAPADAPSSASTIGAQRSPTTRSPTRRPHPEGRKSQRRLDSDRYWNERRRRLIQDARVTTEQRDGREYVVRHLAPQFGAAFE
jgi:hypothetical protein